MPTKHLPSEGDHIVFTHPDTGTPSSGVIVDDLATMFYVDDGTVGGAWLYKVDKTIKEKS